MKTEGLPKVFENLETYEFAVRKGGTELAIGLNRETGEVYLFCRGRHEKKYKMSVKGQEFEAEPFEGVVRLSPIAFGELYMSVMGLEKQTKDLGSDPSITVRGSYKDDTHTPHLIFSDYRNKRRTIVGFFPPRNAFVKAVFETVKDRLPFLRFSHVEEGSDRTNTLIAEYNKKEKILRLYHDSGEVEIKDRQIPFVKFLLEQTVIEGIPLSRSFDLRGFRIFPDGTLLIAGRRFGDAKVRAFLGGNEVQLPAFPLKLIRVL